MPATRPRSYLLVLQGDSSSLFHLPASGEVTIGRDPECDLRLSGEGVSRLHCRLVVGARDLQLSDLGSHGGTTVNGELLGGPCQLCSGDSIGVGAVTLVLHSARPEREPRRRLLDFADFQLRLREELDRAIRYERALHLVAIDLGSTDWARLTANRATTAIAVGSELRLCDVVGQSSEGQLFVAMPELQRARAREVAERILLALLPIAPEAKAGLAGLPSDAGDEPALVAAARGALALATAHRVSEATECVTELQLGAHRVVVADPAMIRSHALLRRLGRTELAVLLLGETGVGKDVAAHLLHESSRRAQAPLLALNCAAMPDNLVESELFGYEKGAFTGATQRKPGLLELASGGTVFLDELGELSLGSQAKLLRAIEARRVLPLGGTRELEIDVRLVAATNRDLGERVKAGAFRQDLFFRLSGATVILPPLRERPREILLAARMFLTAACAAVDRAPMTIAAATLRQLQAYDWPGNLRELKNMMEFAVAATDDEVLQPWHLPASVAGPEPIATPSAAPTRPGWRPIAEELRELERQRMAEALGACNQVQTEAAELIGMPLRTFRGKLKLYGLSSRRAGAD